MVQIFLIKALPAQHFENGMSLDRRSVDPDQCRNRRWILYLTLL